MWYQHRRVSSNFVGLFVQIRSVDTGHRPLSSSPRATSESEDEMQRVAGGEVVLGGRLVVGPAVGPGGLALLPYSRELWGCSHLLAAMDEALLDGRDALLLLDLLLDLRNLLVRAWCVSFLGL